MEASDTTTQRNYYDDLARRAVGHGHPLEAAIEQAASAYLDGKPQTQGKRKLSREFDLTPAGIIRCLDLQRPIYYLTVAYCHFGRDDLDLPWESVRPFAGAGLAGESSAA